MSAEGKEDKRNKKSQFEETLELLSEATVFHDQLSTAYIEVEADDCVETIEIGSGTFKSYISALYFQKYKKVLEKQTRGQVTALLEARALFESPTMPVHIRLARSSSGVLHYLADDKRTVIEVRLNYKLRKLRKTDLKFIRPEGMLRLPLARPTKAKLFELMSMLFPRWTEENIVLVCTWLVGCMKPEGPYMLLGVVGQQGSGKSMVTRLLKGIIDPQYGGIRSLPRKEEDLMIAARNTHIVAFDNVSHLPPWLSDALCRLLSGGGFGTRKLYTNYDEAVFSVARPVLLNSIDGVITRDDLRDRSLIIRLREIQASERQTEAELEARFQKMLPEILTATYRCVSLALTKSESFRPSQLPRMADWYRWVKASEEGMGAPAGLLDKALKRNESEAVQSVLDACPYSRELIDLVREAGEIRKPAAKVLSMICETVGTDSPSRFALPKTAQQLASELYRLEAAFRQTGVRIQHGRRPGGNRGRFICLQWQPPTDEGAN